LRFAACACGFTVVEVVSLIVSVVTDELFAWP
jgi:hypothetical protein